MTLEIATGAKWFWEQYGKALVNKALGEVREQWTRLQWQEAETKYRERVQHLHSTTRLLGNPKPIDIEGLYVDVYMLDQLTALRRYNIQELQSRPLERRSLRLDTKRKPLLRLAVTERRLFLLGRPGSGKTTLLKYLALQACAGKISRTPILVSCREWADSGLELLIFLSKQFEICAFPNAEKFIEKLLDEGNAIVLFDGLDEVNDQDGQRTRIIQALIEFARRYSRIQICVTCRIAAVDFFFDQFQYIEVADFDDRQVRLFVSRWYAGETAKRDRFLEELSKSANQGLRELTRTPLLLALLCLAFDELGHFPSRRGDLYQDTLDALLGKWDASRGICRDEIYRGLSLAQKKKILAYLGYHYFEKGQYFIRRDVLGKEIMALLDQLIPASNYSAPDGEAVLKAIETQHGILSQCAHNIYSFWHLTFQEYFAARYIVDNVINGAVEQLIQHHVTDHRWNEVFLLTASLLDNPDNFFEFFLRTVAGLSDLHESFVELLKWIEDVAPTGKWPAPGNRAALLHIANIQQFYLPRTLALNIAATLHRRRRVRESDWFEVEWGQMHERTSQLAVELKHGRILTIDEAYDFLERANRHLDSVHDLDYARQVARIFVQILGVNIRQEDLARAWSIVETQTKTIEGYLEANELLLRCLLFSRISDKEHIRRRMLMSSEANTIEKANPLKGLTRSKLTKVRQIEKNIGEVIAYVAAVGDPSRELRGVSFVLDLDEGGANSLAKKASVSVSDLRCCSIATFTERKNDCPYPGPDNDSEFLVNSWYRVDNVIVWRAEDLVPAGKIVMMKLHFQPRADLEDGSRIVIRGWRIINGQEKRIGVDYIIRRM